MGGGGMPAETVEEEIIKARELTSKPFGVNIPILSPFAEGIFETAVRMEVPVLTTSAGNPLTFTARAKEAGMKIVHVVSNVRMAEKAQESGVDVIVAEGYEAGGHNGFDEITTMVLVPQVVDAVDVPVVAAGGIADARGMVAAFALGAEGVQLGTRFLASPQSPAHRNYKELIIGASDRDTVITGRAFGPVRVLRSKLAETILQAEREGKSPQEIQEMIGSGRSVKACLEGDLDEGSFMCGQVAGIIAEVQDVKDIVAELIEGYDRIASGLSRR
ncbi:MAG: enoyl-[acyl-carrier-protein] reductase FabK [Actinobacteria bacterium]|nr:MAG: enoyl-[acyl-carrier-protein] reductase FabK [Actinomycetota bacterium]